MKTLTFFMVALFLTIEVFAQTPQSFSYQAVARDNSGKALVNQPVSFRISILSGASAATTEYKEIHNGKTTNTFGLVELEIGKGTPVTGTFSAISWGSNSYFVQIEMDPSGGSTFQLLGTSELLSVPYALHAKTAEIVTGIITETDYIFGASVASGITGTDITNWNNKQDQLIAGTNISIAGNTISAASNAALSIGQSYQGGIIFWLDLSGQHGLIAATTDQSTGIQWYNEAYRYTGTTGDGLYAGEMNTAMIVATQMADNQTGQFAAKVCADYSVTIGGVTYGDWYLPSKYELDLLYIQKAAVGGFASAPYWSSTESNHSYAWKQYFVNGLSMNDDKYGTEYVRAIRAF